MNATFSACGRYRHLLSEPGSAQCGWVMLNPSIAGSIGEDGKPKSDPTNNRVRAFSAAWGFDGYAIANAYDLVATNPANLWTADVPASSAANDAYLSGLATLPLVVVAWGRHARPARVAAVVRLLQECGARLFCLGTNLDGSPKHPLYVASSTPLQNWAPPTLL